MRPARSFLFITILFACVAGSTFLLPQKNLLPESLAVLKKQIFSGKNSEGNRREPIIPDILTDSVGLPVFSATDFKTDTVATLNPEGNASPTSLPASAPAASPASAPASAPATVTSYPQTAATFLSPLKPFLDSLENSDRQVRILYYGDSQIEGDRMSVFLRHELRDLKGGTGPGIVLPLMPVMFTKSVWVQSSPNWERYNYISFSDKKLSHKRFGPLLAFCRYLPENQVSESPQKAYVKIKPSYMADSASTLFERLRIFYNNREGEVSVLISNENELLYSGTLQISNEMREISCELMGAKQVTIEFSGLTSPDIYGISIESDRGVVVDNIPLRGSAGLEFTMVDSLSLKQGLELLAPDLIVLQYGLNIVRNVRTDYAYFKRGIVRQLMKLNDVVPNVPVLIVGVTQMAESKGDTLITFDNIQSIINAQREAAIEGGAAFWDASMAMGGSKAMEEWVATGLIQRDYIHLSYAGADTLAKYLLADILSVHSPKMEGEVPPSTQAKLFFTDGNLKESQTAFLLGTDSVMDNDTLGENVPADIAANLPFSEHPPVNSRFTLNSPNGLDGDYGLGLFLKETVIQAFRYNEENPMGFNSFSFWIFFFIVIALYSFLYKSPFPRNFYLLLVSLFFYYKTGGLFLVLLLTVILVNYCCALLISASDKKRWRKLLLAIGVTANLSILAYFKYTTFFIGVFNDLFGTAVQSVDYLALLSNNLLGSSFDIDRIILPIGISFFLFQAISYIVDVYRHEVAPVKNIADFGFYISFFPQLVAGPIVRASEFIPQISKPFSLTQREFSHALFLVYKGLIKKIVISDFIALNFVDRVFEMPASFSGFENLMAVYGYALQIYCDFSGYTDIAIGLALVMGFRIPVNFNSPYKAVDLGDFWRRWHISLSRWLKDYLYIPLGGNRRGSAITGLNLMVTMVLGGLWHGASMKFVVWGGLHGAGLILSKIKNKIVVPTIKTSRLQRFISLLLTFHFVCLGWIFFRSADMDSATVMLSQIFQSFSPGAYKEVLPAYASVFIVMATGFVIHMLPERIKESYRGLFIRIPLTLQLVIVFLVTLVLLSMGRQSSLPFIYFRF